MRTHPVLSLGAVRCCCPEGIDEGEGGHPTAIWCSKTEGAANSYVDISAWLLCQAPSPFILAPRAEDLAREWRGHHLQDFECRSASAL